MNDCQCESLHSIVAVTSSMSKRREAIKGFNTEYSRVCFEVENILVQGDRCLLAQHPSRGASNIRLRSGQTSSPSTRHEVIVL